MDPRNKNKKRMWLTVPGLGILILWCSTKVFSQSTFELKEVDIHPTHRSYQVEDITGKYGLNSAEISALFQDREGYIWVGTKAGVSRFDGVRFNNFVHIDGRPIGQVHAIEQDLMGTLWIGSEEGLFYVEDGGFHRCDIGHLRIRDVHLDNKGDLWIAGFGFIPFSLPPEARMDIKISGKARITPMVSPAEWNQKIGSLHTWAVDTDDEDHVWLGLDDRHAYFDGSELHVTWIDTTDLYEFEAIAAFNKDSIFWGCEDEGLLFQKDGKLLQLTEEVTSIIHETDINTYFLTVDRLLMLKDGQWTMLHDLSEYGYGHFYTKKLLRDREGNFWIGGIGYFLKLTPARMKSWSDNRHPELIANHGISGLPGGELLLGSYRGQVLQKNGDEFLLLHKFDVPNYSYVSDVLPDHRGWVWYTTSASGIILDRGDGLTYLTRQQGLIQNPQYFLYQDPGGDLWCGGEIGLTRILVEEGGDVEFVNYPALHQNEGQPKFRDMVVDGEDRVWVVSDFGVYRLAGGELRRHELSTDGLQFPVCTGIESDRAGRIWLTTQGQGLLQLEYDKDSEELVVIRRWDRTHGGISDLLLDVHIDQKDRLWTAAPKGVYCMTLRDSTWDIQSFDSRDGWPEGATPHSKFYEDEEGILWVMNYNSLVRMPIYSQPENKLPPHGIITNVELMKEGEDIFQYAANDEALGVLPARLNLPYNKNFIRFQFSSTSFTQPDKNRFQYRLTDLDQVWIDGDGSRNVSYPGLQPGTYRFQVMTYNNDGVPAESPANFSFSILPPWYQTWWAYLVATGCMIFALYYLYRFRLSRKLAYQEALRLQELDEFKSRFYTNITHEFRTPLTVILGMAQEVRSEIQGTSSRVITRSLHMIRRNGENLLNLVDQMLDLSKLETGKLDLQFVQGDMIQFTNDLCESFRSLAQDKNINLTIYNENEAYFMDFDPAQFATILSNLLSNAIKFTPEGGNILVHTHFQYNNGQEFYICEVRDDGKGISKADIPHIFDRFYQVNSTTVREQEGSGIGLALTRELVGLMNGTIEVDSTPGKGTIFTVKLPVTRRARLADNMKMEELYSPSIIDVQDFQEINKDTPLSSALPRILIIEDNKDIILYLRKSLQGRGHIFEARNGINGLKKAMDELPDIIICDIMMPGKDGYEVCATLKSDPRTDHIPIILLTAKSTHKDRMKGLSHGADAYLVKPFSKTELITRLEQLILLRKKLQGKIQEGSILRFLNIQVEDPGTKFVQKVARIINEHIDHEMMGSAFLAQKIGLSESQLYRKLKAISGKSTALFIRSVRLQLAKELILSGDKSISEVAYEVGFNDPSWFSRAFREEFGYAPSEVR